MEEDLQQPMNQLSAHLDRGWDLVAKGDFTGAMLSAQKSLELAADSPDAHNLAGYVFTAQGRTEEALDHYRTALELDEGYVDAMLNAAELLVHPMQDSDEALRLVREALEWLQDAEGDERADALLLEIEIHLLRGDRDQAMATARSLPRGPFSNPGLGLSVARALIDVGEPEDAAPLLEQAIEARPSADAHYYLGLVQESRGERREMLLSFLRTREMDAAAPPLPWSLPSTQFEMRVQNALARLPGKLAGQLEGALVVVTDLPGAEVVAEGVDPRGPLLLDTLPQPAESGATIGRLFVYRRNIERIAVGLLDVEDELVRALEAELGATESRGRDGTAEVRSEKAEIASD